MRTFTRLALVAAVAAAFMVSSSTASAAGTADAGGDVGVLSNGGGGGGALVEQDVRCGIFLGAVPPGNAFTTGHLVVTPSGNASLVCHAEIPKGPPQAVIIRDLPCGLGPGGFTGESHTVITPSGQVTLTCHLNGSSK